MPATYHPPGKDAAMTVDVRVSATELQAGEGRGGFGAAMMLVQVSERALCGVLMYHGG